VNIVRDVDEKEIRLTLMLHRFQLRQNENEY